MSPRQKRIALIVGMVAGLGVAAGLVLTALQSNVNLFYTPTQVVAGEAPKDRTFRVGGMVRAGSIQRDQMTVNFVITDTAKEVTVRYTGILPDLFKEGKGAVVQGKFDADGRFVANEVLAKHDENYMPPEAQHAVDQAQQYKMEKTLK
jgi:cytochrome c-type biogenesis protein CcmE